jgi:hypothetical protein
VSPKGGDSDWFESRSAYFMAAKQWGIVWRQQLGQPECPYVERWALYLGPLGSIRLHHWLASDDTRSKHDHPSDFITLVLKGRYEDHVSRPGPCYGCYGGDPEYTPCCCDYEHGERGIVWRDEVEQMTPGTLRYRKAEHRHTVVIPEGETCWTLLYFRTPRRRWGFLVDKGMKGPNPIRRWVKANKYFLKYGDHPCE